MPRGAASSSVRRCLPVITSRPIRQLDVTPEPDEGWTTTTLVTELVETFAEPNDDRDDPFVPRATRRLDDQLYRWDGWSGAVRPPGSAVDGSGHKAPAPETVPPVDDPVQFSANYDVVPGSLPRLRFGRQYLLRARCVDLAGDSRPLDAPTPPSALPPVETFGRLEPIAAPTVVRRQPRPVPGVGDEPGTIVLRSDYHIDDAEVAAQERLLFPGRVGRTCASSTGSRRAVSIRRAIASSRSATPVSPTTRGRSIRRPASRSPPAGDANPSTTCPTRSSVGCVPSTMAKPPSSSPRSPARGRR